MDVNYIRNPVSSQRHLAAEIQRWVIGAYRGGGRNKVEELTGIAEIGRLMQNKRIGQGLARVEERGHLGIPGAAVYCYILYRMNAINDSLKKKDKRIQWAASVYERHLPMLREVAEPIIREFSRR